MTFRYDREAKQGLPMPDGLTWAEQGTYQAVAALTARYTLGKIGAEQSKKEYAAIMSAYEQAAYRERLLAYHARLLADIELVHIRYRKERTVEAADELSDTLDGFLTRKD